MIRIVLTGAECTGKSSLAAALSGYYGEPWTAEYVRTYVEELDRELNASDLEPVAQGQNALENSALKRARQFILHDTNLLSTILYANHYFGEQLNWVNDTFLSRDYSLYLLCSSEGIDWKDDPGQRDSSDARDALEGKFRDALQRLQLPHLELTGTHEARFGEAVLAIDQLLLEKE
jgi:nicotinamide riboside kinase